jgi:hypothetical protein
MTFQETSKAEVHGRGVLPVEAFFFIEPDTVLLD